MRKQRNTDAEETQFVSASEIAAKRSTDQLDTQQLDAVQTEYRDRNPYRREKQELHGTPMTPEQEAASYREQPYNSNYGNTSQQPYNNGYGNASQQPYNNGYGNAPQQPYNNGYGNAPQQPYNNGYGNAPQQPYNNGYGNAPQQLYNNGYGNAPQQPYNNGYSNAPQQPHYNTYNNNAPRQNYAGGQQHSGSSYRGTATTASPRPQRQQAAPPPQKPPVSSQRSTSQRTAPAEPVRQKAARTRSPKSRIGGGILGKAIRAVLWVIIIVFVLYSAVSLIGILRMHRETAENRANISDVMDAAYVSNVLLIGTDSRDLSQERGRSDSMILASINKKTRELTLTSFLRDSYVYIDDEYGYGKLNAAYSYGGAGLLMDTIESNYGVRIDDYILISFAACANVIDAVGGVKLDLTDEEADAVNEILISEVNELMGDDRNDDLLDCGGKQKLDGKQALSYSRIRYVGNADFERASRQRTVMTQVLKKAAVNPVAMARIFVTALPELSTNLSVGKSYGYTLRAPFLLIGYQLKTQQIPADDTFYGDDVDGESVLRVDCDANRQVLKDTIYRKS
ncbi:MAG: LCP family protein [Ruminococcus sp.]|nr:LCP family protein [Ruminococcus sp.]MDD6430002.1 LCP family protein [Ruminococcus sp.]MDD6586784.1 LCP family protein [Ruminococcus sp.]